MRFIVKIITVIALMFTLLISSANATIVTHNWYGYDWANVSNCLVTSVYTCHPTWTYQTSPFATNMIHSRKMCEEPSTAYYYPIACYEYGYSAGDSVWVLCWVFDWNGSGTIFDKVAGRVPAVNTNMNSSYVDDQYVVLSYSDRTTHVPYC